MSFSPQAYIASALLLRCTVSSCHASTLLCLNPLRDTDTRVLELDPFLVGTALLEEAREMNLISDTSVSSV